MKKRRKQALLSVCCILMLTAFILCGCESFVIHVSEGTDTGESPAVQSSGPDTSPVTDLPDTPPGVLPESLTYDNSACRAAVSALRDVILDSSTFMAAVSDGVADTLFADGTEIAPYYAERNGMAADKYGCKIFGRTVQAGTLKKDISASVKAGGNMTSYFSDILLVDAQTGGELGVSGLLLDLRKLPYYEYGTTGISGAGMYNTFNRFCISDATQDIQGTAIIYFNRGIAGEKLSSELYSAIRNERFTFEYFLNIIKSCAQSADYDLSVGLPGGNAVLADIAAVRSGYDFVSDADGVYPQLCEHPADVTDRLTKLIADLSSLRSYTAFSDADPDGRAVFASGKSLFFIGTVPDMKELSTGPVSYGIAPLPVIGEDITGTVPNLSSSAPVICAPANNSRYELTGAMLTALNAASGTWIADAYINVFTKNYVRDNDSYFALKSALYAERYCDYSDIYGPSVKNLYDATYGSVRKCFTDGTPVADTVNSFRSAVNKALKSVK